MMPMQIRCKAGFLERVENFYRTATVEKTFPHAGTN